MSKARPTGRPEAEALHGVPEASGLYRVVAATALGIFRLQRWQITHAGLDNVPRGGGAVIAANHMSFWDFFTVAMGPYRAWGRPVRILAKQSLFQSPVFGPAMRSAGHIPVRRGRGKRAYGAAVDALRAGELVLVLPEATISPALELLPFKTGAARMAIRAQVPLVPAISWGSHRFHTVGRGPTPRWRLPVTVTYGSPIQASPDADPCAITDRLETVMQDLFDRAVTSYPDGTPPGAWWVPARFGGGAPTPGDAQAYLDTVRRRWR